MKPGRDPRLPLAFALAGAAAIAVVCAVAAASPARLGGLTAIVAGTRDPATMTATPPARATGSPGLPVTSHGLRPPPPDQPPATPPSGVLDTHAGPFPPAEFKVRNAWRGQVGSSVVWAYAGAAVPGKASPGGRAAQARPALRLYLQAGDAGESRASLVGTYTAPGADGPLAIVSADGAVLTLRTDGGGVYHFDLRRRRFA